VICLPRELLLTKVCEAVLVKVGVLSKRFATAPAYSRSADANEARMRGDTRLVTYMMRRPARHQLARGVTRYNFEVIIIRICECYKRYKTYNGGCSSDCTSTHNMSSKFIFIASALLSVLSVSSSAQVISDPGVSGPPLEIIHLYNDQWPTGKLCAKLRLCCIH
jgi:hypothetical protein